MSRGSSFSHGNVNSHGFSCLEDDATTARHVMGSSGPLGSSAPTNNQVVVTASSSVNSTALMLPPKSRPKKKKILTEEEYVGALETIIERDFFPDAATTAHHLSLLDALEKKDYHSIEEIRKKILTEQVSYDDDMIICLYCYVVLV